MSFVAGFEDLRKFSMMERMLQQVQSTVINSLSELRDLIRDQADDGWSWFRGQNNSEWEIQPSLRREMYTVADPYGRPLEPTPVIDYLSRGDEVHFPSGLGMLEAFKAEAIERSLVPQGISDAHLLEVGQHYRLRTLLTDWTDDVDIALFFAMDNRRTGSRPALFSLNPVKMNDFFQPGIKYGKIPELGNLKRNGSIADGWGISPVAVRGSSSAVNQRLVWQRGHFVLAGSLVHPLDQQVMDPGEYLSKYVLDDRCVAEVQTYLERKGLSRDKVYGPRNKRDEVGQRVAEQIGKEFVSGWIEDLKREWADTPELERGVPSDPEFTKRLNDLLR